MSKFKVMRTPGPWTVDDVGYVIGPKGDDDLVASPHGQANAHLISAAPDLLEALQEFIACGPNAGHNQELIMQVNKAIAKARGES